MDNNSLNKTIFKLEKALLQPKVRQSAEKVAKILDADFTEFCSSGKVYRYQQNDVIGNKENVDRFNWEIENFSIELIADNSVLAKYKVIKHDKTEDKKVSSLRSSVWKHKNDSWKMIFHQGTLITGDK